VGKNLFFPATLTLLAGSVKKVL